MKRGVLILLACCPCASALDPSLEINQYAHKAWTVSEGFFKGTITSIAQTPDGYLWLGTEFGLLRFDGVRSVAWQPPAGEKLPSNHIRSLLAARNGRLWIGTRAGLASWKDGNLTHHLELAGQAVNALVEDHQGIVWAGSMARPTGRLCAIGNGSVHCYGDDGIFGPAVLSLYEDRDGVWAGAATGLWRWKPDPPIRYPVPGPAPSEIRNLIEGDNGVLWIAMGSGLWQLDEGKVVPAPLPPRERFGTDNLLRDREGGVWIGGHGLLRHLHHGKIDSFGVPDGLSGNAIFSIFEDHEGNIWVATSGGLDRFRDFAVHTISVKQGLSLGVASVLAARDGSVWFASNGLGRWNNGKITFYRKSTDRSSTHSGQQAAVREITSAGLPDNSVGAMLEDDQQRIWVSTLPGVGFLEDGRFTLVSVLPYGVQSITEEHSGSLWINDIYQGLFHLLDGRLAEQIPWAKFGRRGYASAVVADPARGLWLGFYEGGLEYVEAGQVRASYTAADGLGSGSVGHLRFDPAGALWAATEGGLSRLTKGRIATLTSKNGLPCDAAYWSMEDDAQSAWLMMPCGLVRVARAELDAWVKDPKRMIDTTVFDSSDGVRSHASGYSPRVAKSADGKLWFLPLDGASVIDPRHLPFNKLPPPVHIEEVTADRKNYDASSHLPLPALTRDLEIDYTALSLVAPEKNRFKYKLEGYDRDWQDVGNRRQAFYGNLSPRSYRFRVIASNNSGVWNEAGDSLDFSIDPAYYQTRWFLVSCVAAFFALLWVLYRYRLHQIAKEFNAHLEGRVNERLRVARELHDTLLQSFHGLLPRLQAAVNLLPGRASDARQVLEAAVDDAAQAITEARDAVQDMRSSATTENDLAKAIETVGQELAAHQSDATGDPPVFSLEVEGAAQDLHPILRDEIYRIATEALRNAFQHAQAQGIEVEIRYDPRQLRVRLRDDGIGIDADVLRQEGREGHFGFRGMRERAKSIGGKLEIWSEQGAGTEVELIVPTSVTHTGRARHRSLLFRSKLFRRNVDRNS